MQPAPPCPAPTHWWWTRVSGPLLHWQLWLGMYSVGCFIFFSSWLCCPLRFQNSPQTRLWEGFLMCGDISSFFTLSPGWVSVPKSFVSVFVFYILFYLLSERLGCLSGCLVSSASIQKLFCGSCSAFKWSFDEFVGEKVVSPSYSSATLGLSPGLQLLIDSYFIPQLSSIERHDGGRNNGLVPHEFEIFSFSVASGNFIDTGFVPDFILWNVLSTDIWLFFLHLSDIFDCVCSC